ncbi:MAG: peptidase, partial [Frankiales bacterium]|nr:peptidase [Frankiales bacterium]
EQRAERLLHAQAMAHDLFEAVEQAGILAPGVRESAASDAVRDLAAGRYGVSRHWHKRIVRAGINTLEPYDVNPPDRVIEADDIVFCDVGPVFEEWEADFGRTYVLGADPVKLRMRDDLPRIFDAGRAFFEAHPQVTGERMYEHVTGLAVQAGWEFGGPIAGHLVGEFPHERIAGDKVSLYLAPGSTEPLRRRDAEGRPCHWILEIHLVDRVRGFGAFYEELLDLGTR